MGGILFIRMLKKWSIWGTPVQAVLPFKGDPDLTDNINVQNLA